ncbi:hypothetical protein O0L34_g2236 [Tuta absoluta]|nr:hypothetical protein O0L34_g2236 [Tuta absoluta]
MRSYPVLIPFYGAIFIWISHKLLSTYKRHKNLRNSGVAQSRGPWAALTFSFNEFRVFVVSLRGRDEVVETVGARGAGQPECAQAHTPEERTRSDHAATSLKALDTRPRGTSFHRGLAWPRRCWPAPARYEAWRGERRPRTHRPRKLKRWHAPCC